MAKKKKSSKKKTVEVEETERSPFWGYSGAVVLVSHDEGAVEALNPERVLILPEGTEDHWNPEYSDLISIS